MQVDPNMTHLNGGYFFLSSVIDLCILRVKVSRSKVWISFCHPYIHVSKRVVMVMFVDTWMHMHLHMPSFFLHK